MKNTSTVTKYHQQIQREKRIVAAKRAEDLAKGIVKHHISYCDEGSLLHMELIRHQQIKERHELQREKRLVSARKAKDLKKGIDKPHIHYCTEGSSLYNELQQRQFMFEEKKKKMVDQWGEDIYEISFSEQKWMEKEFSTVDSYMDDETYLTKSEYM